MTYRSSMVRHESHISFASLLKKTQQILKKPKNQSIKQTNKLALNILDRSWAML